MQRLLVVALLFAVRPCLGQGGPPMITDDPDTPGPKGWEINVADLANFSRTQRSDLVPYFDINYGVGDRIQLKVEGGYGLDQVYGQREQSGPGALLSGVKWRFWDQEKDGSLSISMYPQFSFHPSYTSQNTDIAPNGNYWLLPLEFSKRWGKFALNPSVGYQYQTQNADTWFYGLLGAWEPRKDFELLAEIAGDEVIQGGASDLLVNFGARIPLNEKALIIAAVGHTVKILPSDDAQALSYLPGAASQWITYLGMQFRL